MSDYNMKADITGDASGYVSAVDKAKKASKNLATSVSKVVQGLGKNGLVGALGAVGLASAGVTATLGSVVKIAKQISQSIGECTEAYKKQIIAERQLETAINNNPLVTGSAKKALTQFASEMQKVSNYGDEELIPMMANLVSLGRTEEETMQIMAVAMDMSASGSMSLDTAINQLNATLNGNIGRLGQQNAELKGLTEEELKSGKAIEILGEKFKGLSSATLDTSKQLQNIKGDFKEAIGEFTLPTSDMWNKFWIGFYDKGISVIKQFDEYMDKTIIGKGIAEELVKGYKSISDERQKVLYLEDNIHALSESQIVALQKHLESTKNRNKEQEELLRKVKMEVEARTYLAKIYEDMDREEAERQKTEEEQLAIENETAILKGKYLEKIAEQERKWKNIKDVTGEEVKNEEKIKFYQDSLVDLMTQAGGQITTNNQLFKDQIAIIQKLQAELTPEESNSNEWEKKIREQAIARLEAEKEINLAVLEEDGRSAEERLAIEKEYNARLMQLNLERIQEERAEALKGATSEEEKARIIQYYQNEVIENAKKYSQTVTQIEKKAGKDIKEIWKGVYQDVVKTMSKVTEGIKSAMGKAVTFIKNTVGTIKNIGGILSKVFSFDTSSSLDSLLAFEDKVLTFFVETLPKLPAFVESALQSISVLLQNVLNSDTFQSLTDIFLTIVDTLTKALPDLIAMLFPVVEKIIDSIMDLLGNSDFVDRLLDLIEQATMWIANLIETRLPVILDVLIKIVKKITEKTPELLKILIPALAGAIKQILEALPEIIEIALDSLPAILKDILPMLIQEIIKLVPVFIKVIAEIVVEIIKHLPEIVWAIIQGLVKCFTETNWWEIIKECFMGFINAFKKLFGIHSPSTVFADFGKNIVQGLWNGIKSMGEWLNKNVGGFFNKVLQGIIDIFSELGEWIYGVFGNIFSGIGDWFYNIFMTAGAGIKRAFQAIGDWIKETFTKIGDFLVSIFKAPLNILIKGINYIIDGLNKISIKLPDWLGGKSFGISIDKLNYLANGTQDAQKGLAIVGEAGPELVKFNGGEQVLNNRNTQKAIADMNKGGTVFNVTFENTVDTTAFAMMKQLRQYQRNLAFNGVL
jgi:hypothetical protein